MKIAVVAPSCPLSRSAADRLMAIAGRRGDCDIAIHRQCFSSAGHFAGPDGERLAALREAMADPSVDALWFARGGYGSNRIAEAAAADLPPAARTKQYLGYSDAGFLLAAFDRAGLDVAHGPMPGDLLRDDGEHAVGRALDWLVRGDPTALEPALGPAAVAFNLSVLSAMLGTAIEPELAGRELLVEEVAEHHYRIDRLMFHVTGNAAVRKAAGLRLGRVGEVPENDREFGADEEAIARWWCARSGLAWLGRADIGHDSANRVVPFRR